MAQRSRWLSVSLVLPVPAYIPLYPDDMPPLTVVAERVTEPGSMIPFEFGQVAWSNSGIPFYVSGTVLSARGQWRLGPAVGRNHGCFELNL